MRAALLVLSLGISSAAHAEQRLYLLQVTRADGDRYETLSTEDPFTYASLVGASVHVSRDYQRIYSPQVKVRVVDTWIEHRVPLKDHWSMILRERRLWIARNHRLLQRRRPLTLDAMRLSEVAPAVGTASSSRP